MAAVARVIGPQACSTDPLVCRFQKISLYSWAGGSFCTGFNEVYELLRISKTKRRGETDSEWALRRAKAVDEVNTRLLTLFHSIVQVSSRSIAAGSKVKQKAHLHDDNGFFLKQV